MSPPILRTAEGNAEFKMQNAEWGAGREVCTVGDGAPTSRNAPFPEGGQKCDTGAFLGGVPPGTARRRAQNKFPLSDSRKRKKATPFGPPNTSSIAKTKGICQHNFARKNTVLPFEQGNVRILVTLAVLQFRTEYSIIKSQKDRKTAQRQTSKELVSSFFPALPNGLKTEPGCGPQNAIERELTQCSTSRVQRSNP